MRAVTASQRPPTVISPGTGERAGSFARNAAFRKALLASAATALVLLATTLFVVLPDTPKVYGWLLLFGLVGLIVWNRPVVSVFLLVAGAATFESFRLNYPDSLTDTVPFFRSVSDLGIGLDLPFTVVEVLQLWAVAVVALTRIAAHRRPFQAGPLLVPMLIYVAAVILGFLNGIATGGDFRTALWEARAQFYLVLAYLIAVNVVQTRSQIRSVIWVFLIAVAFKGAIGTWRLLVTLGGDLSLVPVLSTNNSLLSHEESLFFALWLAFGAILYLYKSDRRQLAFVSVTSPLVVLALLGNERRAGFLALIVALAIVSAITYLRVPERRRFIATVTISLVVLLLPYLLMFGGSQGLIGQPARAIASIYSPNERDESSNVYRVLETQNLKLNIAESPIIGKGFGKPITLYLPVPDLSHIFSFWDTIPHNTVLWVWMRTGIVGFLAMWFLVGRGVVFCSIAARRLRSMYSSGVATLAVASLAGWLILGSLDMGLVDFRSTLLIGTLLALTVRAAELERRTPGAGR